MTKRFTILGLALAGGLICTTTHAEQPPSSSLHFTSTHQAIDEQAPSSAAQLRSATRVNRRMGFETESYAGAASDRYLSAGMQRDFERDRRPAAYGVVYMPVAPRAQLFARVGYGGSKAGLGDPRDDTLKYGAGAEWRRSERSGIRADYTRQQGAPRKSVKADIVSVGFVRRF